MISIQKLYEDCLGSLNTHQGGHIRPRTFVEWVNDIQIEIYNDLVADFQINQSISDKLFPFLKSTNVLLTNNSNSPFDIIKYPADYQNFSSARIIKKGGISCGCKSNESINSNGEVVDNTTCKFVDEDELDQLRFKNDKDNCELPIQLVDNDKWSAICSHKTKMPTERSPKITQFSGGFKISPKGCASAIVLDYFRLPIRPIFNFTVINPNQEGEYYQYEPSGSVDLEWSEKLIPEFLSKLQTKYSIFTSNNDMFSQSKNK